MASQDQHKPLSAKERAEAEQRRDELRNRLILFVVLLVCLAGLGIVIVSSTPEKSLQCDGSGASLLQFGTCR